jgi:hypothetical protein
VGLTLLNTFTGASFLLMTTYMSRRILSSISGEQVNETVQFFWNCSEYQIAMRQQDTIKQVVMDAMGS